MLTYKKSIVEIPPPISHAQSEPASQWSLGFIWKGQLQQRNLSPVWSPENALPFRSVRKGAALDPRIICFIEDHQTLLARLHRDSKVHAWIRAALSKMKEEYNEIVRRKEKVLRAIDLCLEILKHNSMLLRDAQRLAGFINFCAQVVQLDWVYMTSLSGTSLEVSLFTLPPFWKND